MAHGILLTQDPIGLAGGVNLYEYAGSNPVMFTDPFGLDPCKLSGNCTQSQDGRDLAAAHARRDDAARAAMQQIAAPSVAQNIEYQGEIVNTGGEWTFTPPRPGAGAQGTVSPSTPGYDGYYHSHGASSGGAYLDEDFSYADPWGRGGDKGIADRTGKPGYLVTPSGTMKRYDPDPNYPNSRGQGATTILGTAHP